jgi:hypothetical protein
MAPVAGGLGRAAVVFSSGFFGFFAHAGVLSALRVLSIDPIDLLMAHGLIPSSLPGKAQQEPTQPIEKVSPILIISDPPPFDPSDHHMVQPLGASMRADTVTNIRGERLIKLPECATDIILRVPRKLLRYRIPSACDGGDFPDLHT